MIYAFMKALKSRNTFEQAIQSLVDQVDHLYLAVDEEVDFTHPKVTIFITGNENADLDKILILKEVKIKHNDHIFLCDDDLIYPEDYVEHTLRLSKKHKLPIITYGGSWIKDFPIASYYAEKDTVGIFSKHDNCEVQIPYSGVFYFRANKAIIEALSTKSDMHLPFACDLSIAALLGVLELRFECLSPKEDDWFKHIEMDMSCTIYESFKNNDFEQTIFANKYHQLFPPYEEENEYPFISVIFVITRIKSERDVVVEALKSIKNQIYPNYEIVVIENYDKMKTIGKCFNEGVQEAEGDWLLFFADDDVMVPEYLASLAGAIRQNKDSEIVAVSTNITMFNNQDQVKMNKIPTGAWRKDFLLENPFIEWANRYVDSEMFARIQKLNKKMMVLNHNHGYFYRSHGGQASGMKLLSEEANNEIHNNNVTRLIKETFGD